MTFREKLKSYVALILTTALGILATLFLRQSRKTERAESELANAVAKNTTQENDHDREIAKQNADALIKSYDELKHEYDENRTGGGS